jgi:hypothetical protein
MSFDVFWNEIKRIFASLFPIHKVIFYASHGSDLPKQEHLIGCKRLGMPSFQASFVKTALRIAFISPLL